MPQGTVATPSSTDPDTRFLYLSQEDVVAAGGLDMAAVVDVIERAFRVKAGGHVFMPPKVMIVWSDEPGTEEKHGRIMAMPAYVGGEFDVAGLKWIPSVPDNPARRGLPRANALVLLSDRETGLPLAVMDGTVVSAMRTGAVTGVAVRHLAAPGRQRPACWAPGCWPTRSWTRCAWSCRRSARCACSTRRRRGPQRFCERQAAATGLDMVCAGSAEEAVRGAPGGGAGDDGRRADVRAASGWTRASRWCWSPAWTARSSLHAATDLLVVDDWEHESTHEGRYAQRLVEAGIVDASGGEAVELADVVAGGHPGRTDAAQRIVVSPVGLGMDDVTTAKYVLDRARGWAWAPSCACAPALRSGSDPEPAAADRRRPLLPDRAADGLARRRHLAGRPALAGAGRRRLADRGRRRLPGRHRCPTSRWGCTPGTSATTCRAGG